MFLYSVSAKLSAFSAFLCVSVFYYAEVHREDAEFRGEDFERLSPLREIILFFYRKVRKDFRKVRKDVNLTLRSLRLLCVLCGKKYFSEWTQDLFFDKSFP